MSLASYYAITIVANWRTSQAFHGLAVALVYKYADAIVKNFANSSVMALLIAISYYFFALQTNLHLASVEFSRPEAPANIRPPARPASAKSSSGRPPASTSLANWQMCPGWPAGFTGLSSHTGTRGSESSSCSPRPTAT